MFTENHLHDVLTYSRLINSNGHFHVFFEYSGHVDAISVRIHPSNRDYKLDTSSPVFNFYVYAGDELPCDDIDLVVGTLQRLSEV